MAQTHFHRLLRARVEEAIKRDTDHIASGSLESYDEYRFAAGILYGMRRVLQLCEEIEKDLDV